MRFCMVVESKDLYLLEHYEYGEAFFGSVAGMNYRVARNPMKFVKFEPIEVKMDATLLVTIWPAPKCYDKADKDKMLSKEFPYSDIGKDEAACFISEQYESRIEEWKEAKRRGLFG